MKKQDNKFITWIQNSDKGVLISLCTAALFLLLGIIQLMMIVFVVNARTFDHFLLLFVDLIIAAVCAAYIFHKNGKLPVLLGTIITVVEKASNAVKKLFQAKPVKTESQPEQPAQTRPSTAAYQDRPVSNPSQRRVPANRDTKAATDTSRTREQDRPASPVRHSTGNRFIPRQSITEEAHDAQASDPTQPRQSSRFNSRDTERR